MQDSFHCGNVMFGLKSGYDWRVCAWVCACIAGATYTLLYRIPSLLWREAVCLFEVDYLIVAVRCVKHLYCPWNVSKCQARQYVMSTRSQWRHSQVQRLSGARSQTFLSWRRPNEPDRQEGRSGLANTFSLAWCPGAWSVLCIVWC